MWELLAEMPSDLTAVTIAIARHGASASALNVVRGPRLPLIVQALSLYEGDLSGSDPEIVDGDENEDEWVRVARATIHHFLNSREESQRIYALALLPSLLGAGSPLAFLKGAFVIGRVLKNTSLTAKVREALSLALEPYDPEIRPL